MIATWKANWMNHNSLFSTIISEDVPAKWQQNKPYIAATMCTTINTSKVKFLAMIYSYLNTFLLGSGINASFISPRSQLPGRVLFWVFGGVSWLTPLLSGCGSTDNDDDDSNSSIRDTD